MLPIQTRINNVTTGGRTTAKPRMKKYAGEVDRLRVFLDLEGVMAGLGSQTGRRRGTRPAGRSPLLVAAVSIGRSTGRESNSRNKPDRRGTATG